MVVPRRYDMDAVEELVLTGMVPQAVHGDG